VPHLPTIAEVEADGGGIVAPNNAVSVPCPAGLGMLPAELWRESREGFLKASGVGVALFF